MGLSFYVMASYIGSMVSDSLFQQRIRSDRASLETLAVRIAPLLARSDAPALQSQLLAAGGDPRAWCGTATHATRRRR